MTMSSVPRATSFRTTHRLSSRPKNDHTLEQQPSQQSQSSSGSQWPGLILQPYSRPISQRQLTDEIKTIYAGLIKVEYNCIHLQNAQHSAVQDWQHMTNSHLTLLYEHHDFFLASQHPFASPAIRRSIFDWSMPGRMWIYGICKYLEILRRYLPESLDHTLTFFHSAYELITTFYEAFPVLEDTWVEYLRQLGCYRMKIEDVDRVDWAGVAPYWEEKAKELRRKLAQEKGLKLAVDTRRELMAKRDVSWQWKRIVAVMEP